MKKALILLALLFMSSIAEAQTYYFYRYREHATDCTSLTDGKSKDLCFEIDDKTLYKCVPTSGDCDSAGEWKLITGNLKADPAGCSAGQFVSDIAADGTLSCSTPSGSGSGDVTSNTSSSIDSELALFSSTTGKVIKRASGTGVAKLTSGVLSTVTAPSGTIVGTTDTQTLTNKTFDTASNTFAINGQSVASVSGNTSKVATASGTLTSGNYVKFDASGNLVDGGTGSGSTTPGGTDTLVQFNDGGSTFGGDAGFTYAKTTDIATIKGGVNVGQSTDTDAQLMTVLRNSGPAVINWDDTQDLFVSTHGWQFQGTSANPGSLDLFEASANGTNKITTISPSSISSDRTCTLQDSASPYTTCVAAASESASGIVELATAAETTTGTDNTRAVSPDGLAGSTIFGIKTVEIPVFDFTTDTAIGDGKFYFRIPQTLNGMNLVAVHAQVITAGTTGTTDIQLARCATVATGNVCSGTVVDILTTKLTIDSGEDDSSTAATAAVINTSNDDVATNQVIRVDVDAVSTTAAKGLLVSLDFQLP